MTEPLIHSESLDATFKGIQRKVDNVTVNQFLGIKYGVIPARFEKAVPLDSLEGAVVDATKFGYVQ